jgi:hypothetical protein
MPLRLRIHLVREDRERSGSSGLVPILQRLDDSFVPPPTHVRTDNKVPKRVSNFDSDAARKSLDTARFSTEFLDEELLRASIGQMQNSITVSIFVPYPTVASISPLEIRTVFVDLINILNPTYARVHMEPQGQILHREHYSTVYRTFHAAGLYWLNFFGPDEEKAQGGPALADNPFATSTRLPQGLLLQVCDSPIEATTPEGIERLVAATRAMPQLKQDEEDGDGELIDVGGITVAYSPSARRLVVPMLSRTIGKPIGEAEAKAIAELPQVSGLEVEQITVDFLTKEIATSNRAVLARHGVISRYWDEHEREYREA